MSIVNAMVEQRRLARHARCRVKEWRVTDAQAWELAEDIRSLQHEFNDVPDRAIQEIVESLKNGNVRVLGAKVVVR